MNSETATFPNTTGAANTGSNAGLNGNNNTVHRVAQKAHEAVDKLEQTIGTSSEKVMTLQQEYGDVCREQIKANPLATVAGAFAAGFILAKILR